MFFSQTQIDGLIKDFHIELSECELANRWFSDHTGIQVINGTKYINLRNNNHCWLRVRYDILTDAQKEDVELFTDDLADTVESGYMALWNSKGVAPGEETYTEKDIKWAIEYGYRKALGEKQLS